MIKNMKIWDGSAGTHVGEELVDPVTGRVGDAARPFSPSKLEPLCDLSLGVGWFTENINKEEEKAVILQQYG